MFQRARLTIFQTFRKNAIVNVLKLHTRWNFLILIAWEKCSFQAKIKLQKEVIQVERLNSIRES